MTCTLCVLIAHDAFVTCRGHRDSPGVRTGFPGLDREKSRGVPDCWKSLRIVENVKSRCQSSPRTARDVSCKRSNEAKRIAQHVLPSRVARRESIAVWAEIVATSCSWARLTSKLHVLDDSEAHLPHRDSPGLFPVKTWEPCPDSRGVPVVLSGQLRVTRG